MLSPLHSARVRALLGALALAGCGRAAPASAARATGGMSAGDVRLDWTFADGATCAQLAGQLSSISVSVHGPSATAMSFPCVDGGGAPGGTLHGLAVGDYTYSVGASDAAGQPLYAASGNFKVSGTQAETELAVLLVPVGRGAGGAILSVRWQFGPQLDCGAAQVSQVLLKIGNGSPRSLPCSAGGVEGADLAGLQAGTTTLFVQGLVQPANASQSIAAYAATLTVVLNSGVTLVPVTLDPITGSLDLHYALYGSTCQQAGVTQIAVSARPDLPDGGQGEELSGYAPGATVGCSDPGMLHWDYFPARSFTLRLSGQNAAGQETWSAILPGQVDAGVMNQIDAVLHPCATTPGTSAGACP